MDLTELKQEFEAAKKTDSFTVHNEFIKNLLSSDAENFLEAHYSLLADKENKDLHRRVSNAFEKRGSAGEKFLIKKLGEETNVGLQADVLQILGKFKSRELAEIIPHFLNSPEEMLRQKAIIVTGWFGNEPEIYLLNDHYGREKTAYLRGFTATSMRQIWFRNPDLKDIILRFYYRFLTVENDETAIAMIVVSVQDLMRKKFGLKENYVENEISGDVEKAKQKALKALETYFANE